MAMYHTDRDDSGSLYGEHDNILDYRDECQDIAKKYFSEYGDESVKMVVFDFHLNTSAIFEFSIESKITCTTY